MDPAGLNRREVGRWLAGGAAVALGGAAAAQRTVGTADRLPDPMIWAPRTLEPSIADPREAINVFDFETAASRKVPPAHFGYLETGVDDEVSLRANREGFLRYQLRPRRLVDVSRVETTMRLFGETWRSPIMLAPIGGHRVYHPAGEVAVARAAAAGGHAMILSSMSSMPVDQVTAAHGRPVWFQLYPTDRFDVARALMRRAEQAGCRVMTVTVDRKGGRNQETLLRMRRLDTRVCGSCHNSPNGPAMPTAGQQPLWDGVDLSGMSSIQAPAMSWDTLKRIRDATGMKCVVKGLLTGEDARLAADHGYDGIIVSNHGGRADEAGLSTIEVLPEIVAAVAGRVPVLVDGGFRRGTDIVKALALGAGGVAIGRPYLWGLGAFGEAGVARVLELLRLELATAMQQVGAPELRALVPQMVRHV